MKEKATVASIRPLNTKQSAPPRAPTFANIGKYPPDSPFPATSFDEETFTFYMTGIVGSYGMPEIPPVDTSKPSRHAVTVVRWWRW